MLSSEHVTGSRRDAEKIPALFPIRMFSSTVDALFDFDAFRRNDDIPPVEKFVELLESKLSGDMKIALHLSRKKAPVKFDAPKPGATGRVREPSGEFIG